MFHHTFAAMNTRFSMVLPGVGPRDGRQLASAVEALLAEQERMMSRFATHGDLATLNRQAASGPAPVPDALWDVLQACRRHHRLTGGAFDIALGARVNGHGMHLLDFDDAWRTLRLAQPDVTLDLGGIGKGIALDRVRQTLMERDVTQAFLSFGESSIGVIGSHPAGACWPVGVADLFEPGKTLHVMELRDAAMSTSGNRAGQRHIVNPHDGRMVTGCTTMSVSCASATDAEVLSTALLVLPVAVRDAVLRNYPGAQAVQFAYREREGSWTVERKWQHDA